MSYLNPDILTPVDCVLDNLFASSIVPQLFIDSNMILRRFTSPAADSFSLTPKDMGISILKVKERMGYQHLIEKIRGVFITERCLSKEIKTCDGRLFQMNIQPFFGNNDQSLEGVIITLLDVPDQLANIKKMEELNAQHNTLMNSLSHEIKQPLSKIAVLSDVLLETFKDQDEVLFEKWINILKTTSNNMQLLLNDLPQQGSGEKTALPGESPKSGGETET